MLDVVLQTKRAAVVGLITCAAIGANDHVPLQDHRVLRLEAFFQAYNCPTPLHVEDYVRAADIYALDYRLLPAISLVESTCGAYQRLNNRWGWTSPGKGFSSVGAGIEYVASQLAENPYYKGKTLDQKLLIYNHDRHYMASIRRLMRQIEN